MQTIKTINTSNFSSELNDCKSVEELSSIFEIYLQQNDAEGILEITRFLTYKARIQQIISKNENCEDIVESITKNNEKNTTKNNEKHRAELIKNIYNLKKFLKNFSDKLKIKIKNKELTFNDPKKNQKFLSNLDKLLDNIKEMHFNLPTLENGDIDLKVAGDQTRQCDEREKNIALGNHYANVIVAGNVLQVDKTDLGKTGNLGKTANLNTIREIPKSNTQYIPVPKNLKEEKSNIIQHTSNIPEDSDIPNIPSIIDDLNVPDDFLDIPIIKKNTPIKKITKGNSNILSDKEKQGSKKDNKENIPNIQHISLPTKEEEKIDEKKENTQNVHYIPIKKEKRKIKPHVKFKEVENEDKEEDEKICYEIYNLLFDCLQDAEKEKEDNFIKKKENNDIWYNDIFKRIFEYDVIKNNNILKELKFKEIVDDYIDQPTIQKKDKRENILLIIEKIRLALMQQENNEILERSKKGSENQFNKEELIEIFLEKKGEKEKIFKDHNKILQIGYQDEDGEEDDDDDRKEEKEQFKKIQGLCSSLKIDLDDEKSENLNIVININIEINNLAKMVEAKLNKKKDEINDKISNDKVSNDKVSNDKVSNDKVSNHSFFIEENSQSKNKEVLNDKRRTQGNIFDKDKNVISSSTSVDKKIERNVIENSPIPNIGRTQGNIFDKGKNVISSSTFVDKKIEKNIIKNNPIFNNGRTQGNISHDDNIQQNEKQINNSDMYKQSLTDEFNSIASTKTIDNSNKEVEFKISSDKNKSLNLSSVVQELEKFDFSIIKGYGKIGDDKDYLQINPLNIWRFLLGEIKDSRSLESAFTTSKKLKENCEKSENLETFKNFFQYTIEIMETIQGYIKNNKEEGLIGYLVENKLYSENKILLIKEIFNNKKLNTEEKLAQLMSKSKLYKEVSKIADREVVFSKTEEVKKINDKKQEIVYEKKITDLVQFNVKIPNLKYIDKISTKGDGGLLEELDKTSKGKEDKKTTSEIEIFINEKGIPQIVKEDFDYAKIINTKGYIMYFKDLKAAKYFIKSHIGEENKKNKEQSIISGNQSISNINTINTNLDKVIDKFNPEINKNQSTIQSEY